MEMENYESHNQGELDQSLREFVVHTGGTKYQTVPKKTKRGVIYVSTVPKYMTVAILREHLGAFAPIGRVYLQAASGKTKKRKMRRQFLEGWVEFESKRAAKQIAACLNNTPIATRKGSKFCDVLWCLKYLPRLKWTHLSERLTYEKAVYKQRLKAEVGQARKEASFFQANLDKSERMNKRRSNE